MVEHKEQWKKTQEQARNREEQSWTFFVCRI